MTATLSSTDWEEFRFPIPTAAVIRLVADGFVDPDVDIVAPAIITPTPSTVKRSRHFHPGATFDVDEVERVILALRALRHTKGRWSGRPLNPDPWQVLYIIAPVFGWRNADGFRIIRDVWVEVPRKNGKSTLISGLLLVLLLADREVGAEVYAAAGSVEQAGQVFEPAKTMAERSPAIRGKVKCLTRLIRAPKTGGTFRVLSKVAETAHGLNVHGAGIDEVHVHKNRDLIDAIETGTGAREQPLIFLITTSDDGSRTTIYAEKREEVEALADDRGDADHEHYGVIWMAPEGRDPFELETIRMANPGIGITVHEDYLLGKARKAQRTPSFMPTYERLHLNRRRNATVRAINMEDWDAGGQPGLSLEQLRRRLKGRRCYGGLDLATTQDFAAWAVVVPDEFEVAGETHEGCWVVPRIWVPRSAVEKRKSMRSTLEQWAAEGWLTIHDGEVVDFDLIEDDIGTDAEWFDIGELAYDPWQAEHLRQHLVEGGLLGWKCPQTMAQLSPATHEIDRLLPLHLIRHGGNPLLSWMAMNVVAKRDSQGRWKPEKDLSAEKIDGFQAFVMGLAAWRRADRELVYAPASAKAATGGDEIYRPSGRLKI